MEFNEMNIICRLCLKKLTGTCEPIEELVQHTLNFLTLCPNLTISDDPMFCETCAINLKKCFDFKARCLSIEECIASFAEGKDKKVDLRDVYWKVKLYGNIDRVPDDHSVCRFCLELVNDDASTSVRHDIDIVVMLQKYFLEVDLTITDDIIACTPCYKSLQFHVSFVHNYVSIEEKINEYCKVEGVNHKGQVDLRDVAIFISKGMLNVENSSLTIKEDEHENIINTNVSIKVDPEDPTDVEFLVPPFLLVKENLVDNSFQQSDCEPQLTRTKAVKHKCVMCAFETKRKDCLRQHMLTHMDVSEIEMHKCEVCSFETKWKQNLQKHTLLHKNPSDLLPPSTMYKCELCDYKTKHKGSVKNHMLTHKTQSETTMYKCDACSFETKYKNYLQEHRLVHMDVSEIKMHKCELCSFETKRRRNLREHQLSHRNPDEVTMYKCDLCDYEAKQKWYLKGHMQTHQVNSRTTVYKCDSCPYVTIHRGHLQQHKLTHIDNSKIEMHKCEMCPFESKWKRNLQKHLLSHRNTPDIVTPDITYKCDLCDYEVKQRSNLKGHMLTHKTHSDMYKCDQCDYETKRKSSLKRHMLSHKSLSEVTLYKCEVCPVEIKYKHNFMKHMLSHKNTSNAVT